MDSTEDHAVPAVGGDVLRCIQLPARVRCWIAEPSSGRARSLARLHPGHAPLAEDPRQRRDRWRGKTHRLHPLVHADRAVVQPGRFERSTDLNGLIHDLLAQRGGRGAGTSRARLEHSRGPVGQGSGSEGVERLAGNTVLDAERAHRPARRVIRPPRDGEADSGIDRLVSAHRPFWAAEVSPPPALEVSPMS